MMFTSHLNKILSTHDLSVSDVVIVSDNHQLMPENYRKANQEREKTKSRLSGSSHSSGSANDALSPNGRPNTAVSRAVAQAVAISTEGGPPPLVSDFPSVGSDACSHSYSSDPLASPSLASSLAAAPLPSGALPSSSAASSLSSSSSRAAVLAMALMAPKQTPCRWSGASNLSNNSLESLLSHSPSKSIITTRDGSGSRRTATQFHFLTSSSLKSFDSSTMKHAASDSVLNKPVRCLSPGRPKHNANWNFDQRRQSRSQSQQQQQQQQQQWSSHGRGQLPDLNGGGKKQGGNAEFGLRLPPMRSLQEVQEELYNEYNAGADSSNATAFGAQCNGDSAASTPRLRDGLSAFPSLPRRKTSSEGPRLGHTQSEMNLQSHRWTTASRSSARQQNNNNSDSNSNGRWGSTNETFNASSQDKRMKRLAQSREDLLGLSTKSASSSSAAPSLQPSSASSQLSSRMKKSRSMKNGAF